MAIGASPRLGITRWSADTDVVSRAQFDGDHGRLDDLVAMAIQGLAADRPAAAIQRRLYYATDTGVLSLDTGTAWIEVLTEPRANTAYLQKTHYDEIDITAGALGPTRGAPSLAAAATFWPVWLLDAASTEAVSGVIRTPGDWATVNIVLWWINAGTGTGDARVRVVTRNQGNGELLAADANPYLTLTAAGQNVLVATTLATGVTVDSLKVFLASIERSGADALDTLANDIGVVAVLIQKAS
jgi:hypothetical protein